MHARDDDLIQGIDDLHAHICETQRKLFRLVLDADRRDLWKGSGARDTAHWLAMHLGISEWKARRWVAAAHVLEGLPRISEAFATGVLDVDKVVELTRFATAETEERLIRWAWGVSCGCIRRKADVLARAAIEEVRDVDRQRSLSWWYFDEGRRFGLEAELPAAEGAVVAKALARLAAELPVMPGEEDALYADARRADALVALASARIGRDAEPDRATVVVHAQLETLVSGGGGSELENGPAIHRETVRRLLCNARIQAVIEDPAGDPVGVGRMSRVPPAWMMRQLRYRDRECRFPGCGARRFTHAHHIEWWEHGGSTDLGNLVLVCAFHHKLVHEHGWTVEREADGTVGWRSPDGTRHVAGPAPPVRATQRDVVYT